MIHLSTILAYLADRAQSVSTQIGSTLSVFTNERSVSVHDATLKSRNCRSDAVTANRTLVSGITDAFLIR
jgi:hypothetical protein